MTRENPSIAAFKVWVFPTLVSLISLLIWNDVNEIKADVKLLMAQSNIDKTRIDNLERQMFKAASAPIAPTPQVPVYQDVVAVLPDDKALKLKTIKYDF
ncbi:MAG: hypothetical protein ACR2IJ_04465 [Fluviibacter sp.]